MFTSKTARLTTLMIYIGTLLLSVLSFFTTYYGMTILVDTSLAIVGSLGLQIALLGIAWNLIKVREKRLTYVTVFAVAAVFSVFFSYANFDSALKADTRSSGARAEYTAAARPFLNRYSATAQKAALKGEYQVQRLNKLLEMEEKQGWATVIDEGTEDEFIQSVIEGARRTVNSWNENLGEEYRQGSGRGIIVNFLESRTTQAQSAVDRIHEYVVLVDSLSLMLTSGLPVDRQHELVNMAWVSYPLSEVGMLMGTAPHVFAPPDHANYVERPTSRQQAFLLVIGDLFEMDYLAAFSLLLAIAIDLIVVIMAFAGSHIIDDMDYIFDRIKQNTARRLGEISLDDAEQLTAALNDNVDKFRTAINYRLDLARVSSEYKDARKEFTLTLGSEGGSHKLGTLAGRIRSHLPRWAGGETIAVGIDNPERADQEKEVVDKV